MKKIILTAAILLSSLTVKIASAQISLNINIGSQPAWGPVGYDHVDYYYLPDIDSYYDINAHQYVYFDNNVWVHGAMLPPRFGNYDVYRSYKVVVNERTPWIRNDVYKRKYASYKGRHDQVVIRDSHDEKYRNHWVERKTVRRVDVKYKSNGNKRGHDGHDKHGNGHRD
ncbi:hypothetical protein DIU31_029385 [Mucilaginibacter rubeus]|uniref:Uncharacterized protein n=1 Tax=Mucilaginibacter rubeus TaxID=2027860 RepID=A0AAE6ML59_9SPHI|nr:MULTISPECIES: hypothetical protein [Mucilaginibacter]QEM07416.1 hypothetical protein DIU31_029385 [Mucilaginibacter rubeus]QEM19869.1 hypothetical protein DIU38_028970 [Mucilaginibacter gossypii]QTE43427.1 hypothetical protein J3L19_31665 [Mucilaginibacter rubeus]QTE50027.1 hypothetical protein J3L21_31620 [Mucilaginibacter rubeus]QTE55117.1 hypothetical protein J3L23_23240 [Mucilaginibacter rubeus]